MNQEEAAALRTAVQDLEGEINGLFRTLQEMQSSVAQLYLLTADQTSSPEESAAPSLPAIDASQNHDLNSARHDPAPAHAFPAAPIESDGFHGTLTGDRSPWPVFDSGVPPLDVDPDNKPTLDSSESEREEVRLAVEQLKTELAQDAFSSDQYEDDAASETAFPGVPSQPSDEDVRDEVRRAVEAARAELEAADDKQINWPAVDAKDVWQASSLDQEPESALVAFATGDGAAAMEIARRESAPTMIVIDDPDGRIELVRIYQTLEQVDCSEVATLLNYSSHNVAIGLGLAPMPESDRIKEAVTAAFGRSCEVRTEGERLAVRIASAA